MTEDVTIGFYPDMPHDEYLKVEALSNSGLKKLMKTPAHFKAPQKPPTSQQQAVWDWGTAFHVEVLEPDKYNNRVIVTSKKTITAGEKKEAAEEGKVIIKEPAHIDIQGAVQAARDHPDSGPLLKAGGVTEMSFFWEDPEYGFLCKGRADKITDSRITMDLKSTGDAEDESRGFGSFWKNFISLRYRFQAYWYLNGLTIASGVPHDRFVFIAVEKEPPYGLNVFEADKEVLLWAMEEIDPLKRLYSECLASNLWPCYPTGIKTIGLPPWAKRKYDE